MVERELNIINPMGLHARSAGTFCMLAGTFKCNVTICFKGKIINGKSPLSIMTGGLKMGSSIVLKCNGEDEAEALQTLTDFIKNLEE